MKFEDYLSAVIISYPDRHFDVIMKSTSWNKIDLLKAVCEELFIDGEVDSILAVETRRQLIYLRENGVHCFDRVMEKWL